MTAIGNGTSAIVLGALLIFLARVSDVTLGTLRISFISKGEKFIAPAFAFFEMLIWLFAIRQIVQNLDNPFYFFAYALGFSTGVFVGLLVEEKLAFGTRLIRTITRMDAAELIEALRGEGFGVTSVDAEGNAGSVSVIYSVIRRADLDRYVALIKSKNPNAFYSIEDIRSVREGVFPTRQTPAARASRHLTRLWGKTK